MNIHEATISGKPFSNPSMIGAWLVVDGYLVHRDNKMDFKDLIWIRRNCINYSEPQEVYWMGTNDLIRTDWFLFDI